MSTGNFIGSSIDEPTTELEDRTCRALEEYISILPDVGNADGDTIYTAVSGSGSTYTVDVAVGRCTCPDSEYRDPDNGCKHVRRARFALGLREIPDDPAISVDPQLGVHTDADVKHE
ncbi:hypothetical protein [Halobacterium salinarum]|uniref:hypothetical protein n=1 Tax=Halobacterium salinarum TaxID=2242 RepID=UPI001F44091A|nr:hypothetical protein [Halobacterium salinarum]MCF2165413.1 hypothetical protein [Halobacterium salinarum]MCF2168321.1 hypothetical protein [Halobacterium salinarum]